jgi:dCMP deaminase
MDKWTQRFIEHAAHVARWSKDPSTQVGAVIADDHHRCVSQGYNGFARGVSDTPERLHDRPTKLTLTLHAEENAIYNARRSVEGCTIYTWPMPPCAACASRLIQVGIVRVVAPLPNAAQRERWGASFDLAEQLYAEAGIEFVQFPVHPTPDDGHDWWTRWHLDDPSNWSDKARRLLEREKVLPEPSNVRASDARSLASDSGN